MIAQFLRVEPSLVIPEHSTLPGPRDALRCFPLRQERRPLGAFSLDIKSAHKRISVRHDQRGLLGFQLDNRLFFYNVCPFGAGFSAHWWTRVGSFILRLFHHIAWLKHCMFLFVDDYFGYQRLDILPVAVTLLALTCQALSIPISWRKGKLGCTVTWTGWKWRIFTGQLELPVEKFEKLRSLISQLLAKVSKQLLERFLGLAMWVTQMFGLLRAWLHPLYTDVHAIPATHFSVDPEFWPQFCNCLNDKMIFDFHTAAAFECHSCRVAATFGATPACGHTARIAKDPLAGSPNLDKSPPCVFTVPQTYR